jgi:DNA invertase Pin-like site-specific DNA recombinase
VSVSASITGSPPASPSLAPTARPSFLRPPSGVSELVTAQHLSRRAVIYIRQSSPQQVLSNQESLRLQYALRQRAEALGWAPERIEVIDTDLGLTAAAAQHRAGFQQLVAQVTLGEVGIVLSLDVTRLSRNCSDWYPLLDLCGFRQCLIADRDSVYDPATPNGRLLLGLKGQISELELHTIRARLLAGLFSKAERGELAQRLPVGLVRDAQGVVQRDPNVEVQARLALVFATFLERRTASQVTEVLNARALTLPRRDRFGDAAWRRPTLSAVLAILRNPAYAGAFVYGRFERVRADLARRPRQRPLPPAAWRVCVRDRYPAYIDWATFEQIQGMLDDNRAEYTRAHTRGVPRDGAALLAGLVYCGESGHKLIVQYKHGRYYRCIEPCRRYGGRVCQQISIDPVDAWVVAAFFAALAPAELDIYDRAVSEQRAAAARLAQAQVQQLERLRYTAALAERQYRRVDPDNRLVAGELERRWEHALRALASAERDLSPPAPSDAPVVLSAELRAALLDVGRHLPALWASGQLTRAHQKALLRCLIDKVVLHRPVHDRVRVRIVWRGGDTTTADVPLPVGAFAALESAAELEAATLALVRAGHRDDAIAEELTRRGFRSPRRTRVLPSTVRTLRLKHRLFVARPASHPRRPAGHLSVTALAARLGVAEHWVYARLANGRICVPRDPATGLYLFADDARTLTQLHRLKAGELQTVRL